MRNTTMQVTTSINNIIVGKLNIDHGGIMAVRNPTHGLAAKMKFKQPGLLQFRGGPCGEPPPPPHTHTPSLSVGKLLPFISASPDLAKRVCICGW